MNYLHPFVLASQFVHTEQSFLSPGIMITGSHWLSYTVCLLLNTCTKVEQ